MNTQIENRGLVGRRTVAVLLALAAVSGGTWAYASSSPRAARADDVAPAPAPDIGDCDALLEIRASDGTVTGECNPDGTVRYRQP